MFPSFNPGIGNTSQLASICNLACVLGVYTTHSYSIIGACGMSDAAARILGLLQRFTRTLRNLARHAIPERTPRIEENYDAELDRQW